MIRPALPLVLLVLSARFGLGAPITWDPPFNITSVDDISTTGTLVEAKNTTSGSDSPTVNVGGENITFEAFDPGVSGTGTGTFYTGGGGDSGDANLNTVLNSHVWSGNDWSFQLTGLTSGTEYQIQLIAGGDTRGCCSGRNQRGGDGEPSENISGDFSRSGVGSVTGKFTASGSTQTIRILEGSVEGTDPSMSGYVLRELTVVPPSAPTGIVLSNTDLAPDTAAGTPVGSFATTDPNAADTHTYSLVSTGSFPDNNDFTIVSDELRAAAQLGGFGASYQIRVRTTDNTARTYDETFTLAVEEAQAPEAVTFNANTVLQSTPVDGTVGTFGTVDPNSSDAHTYTLVPGFGDDDNGSFAMVGNELRTNASMPGLGTVLSVRVRSTDLSGLWVENDFQVTVVNTSVRINEFLADNTSTSYPDEDMDTPDWIELHNPAGGSVSLAGWFLTDDPGNLTKWQMPAVSIDGNGYLVIFASGKDRSPTNGDPLHTNFLLAQSGEYVALVAPDGITVVSDFGPGGSQYPDQRAGISYGFFGTPLQIGFMSNPTPNAANDAGSGLLGFVDDTEFDIDRGFYSAPFSVTITCDTPGATIRYTTDGSWPSETAGTIYTAPVLIDRTLPLKAIAYKSGYEPSNVDTQTYIFVDDVVGQTSGNTQSTWGFPSSWDGQSPYYGMNNNASINPLTHPTIKADLREVPTLSIAMESDDLFGSSGIYSHPTSSGRSWERKTSLEFIDPAVPDGGNDFQQNCAIRIQGGAFRNFGLTRKKSFRVLFKSQYGTNGLPTGGPGTLTHDLFGSGATDEFETLTFRMEANDGWQWGAAGGQPQYARDEFGRRVQLALGQPASHGRACHLYLNGVYWGLYNMVERPDSGFAESYLGADRDLWQGQNSGNPINDATNTADWSTMLSVVDDISSAGSDAERDAEYLQSYGFNPDGTRNPACPIWIDATNFIDYLIVNWYGGNSDWPRKNYYCGRAREPDSTGFKFFMWDSEWSLFLRSNINTDRSDDFRGVAAPQEHLAASPAYRVRFGDRLHRACFNDGPLVPANARAIYDGYVWNHENILNPEAARWGDQHGQDRDVGDWQNEYSDIVNDWFPVRTGNFLNHMRSAGLYPDIDAPIFSQHGGSVPMGGGPTLIVPETVGTIYYMFGPGDADPTDYAHSLDPRLVGGGIHPSATLVALGGGGPTTTVYIDSGDAWNYLADGSNQDTAWRGVGFNDAGWASGPSELGYGDDDEETEVGYVDIDPGTPDDQKNATTYFRKVVNIPDPTPFADFTIDIVYDDAYAIYVNGNEVARHSGLSANAPFDEYASNTVGNNASASHTVATGAFVAGNNTIAVEMHQTSETSSDISFDLTLTGNPPGGGNTHASDPLGLTEPGWLLSRSYNPGTGEWSALNAAFFTIDTIPADATNLIVSEFHYHPAEPALPAETAISTDQDDYEFVELRNIASQPIDLTGVCFSEGITYYFPDNTVLPAGGRLVLARHAAAFAARYGRQPDGVYSGGLSNDGENLLLESTLTGVIRDFTYNDQLPWPVIADGDGPSLVLINPAQPAPNHGTATNWAPSGSLHGSPGAATPVGFAGDPNADNDDDGFSAFLEFVLGRSDSDPSDVAEGVHPGIAAFTVGMETDDYLTLTVRKNLLAHNIVSFGAEVSSDLSTWIGGDAVVFVSETENGDGTATVVWRSATPISAGSREFIRLRAMQN